MNLGTASIIRANSRYLPLADNSVDLVVTSPPYRVGVPQATEATITGYTCACPEPTAATTPAVVLDPFGDDHYPAKDK